MGKQPALTAVTIGLFVIAAGLFTWYFWPKNDEPAPATTTGGGSVTASVEITDEPLTDEEEPATEDETESTAEPEVDTVSYVQYRNEEHGLAFEYPDTFEITEEGIRHEYDDGTSWFRVALEETDGASFYIEVNPDGYGPFFPDIIFKLGEADGKAVILSEEEQTTSESEDGRVEYTASIGPDITIPLKGYFIFYSNPGEPNDVDLARFRRILESIEFLQI